MHLQTLQLSHIQIGTGDILSASYAGEGEEFPDASVVSQVAFAQLVRYRELHIRHVLDANYLDLVLLHHCFLAI